MKKKIKVLLHSWLIVCAGAYHLNCQAAAMASSKVASSDSYFSIGGEFGWGTVYSPTSRQRRVTAGFGSNLLEASRGSKTWSMRISYIKPCTDKWSYGAEMGYDDFGSSQLTYSSRNQYSFSEQSYNILAIAKYSLNQQWGLVAKAGAAVTQEQYQNVVRVSAAPDYYSAKRKVLPIVKGGVILQVSQKVQLTATYSHVFGNDQQYISQAFGKLNPSTGPDVLSNVASANSINIGINVIV